MKTTQLNQYNFQKIVLLILALVAAALYFRNCSNPSLQAAQQSKDIADKKINLSQVQIWKDKYNNEHFKLERLQVDKVVLQVQVDSLAKLLKIKAKQIQSFTNIKSGVIIDKKLEYVVKYDTIWKDGSKTIIEYRPFTYSDKWINIKGDLGKSDSIHIIGVDTLTKVDYWKRKWFLGKKHYYSDFSNQNPYVKIQGLKQVEIKPTTTKWSIGPSFQLSARLGTSVQIIPSVGVSLQYNAIRF